MRNFSKWVFATAWVLPAAASAGALSQNALQFAGDDDRVTLSGLPAFINDLSQDFTITLWLRRDAAATQRVFFAQVDANNFASLLLSASSTSILYVRRAGVNYVASSPPIAEGVWTHLALRWTAASNTPEILIDGVLQSSALAGVSSTGTNGVMTLGARTDGAQPLNGALEDFSIWGILRSAEQIRAERVSSCIVGSGLQARYDFNVGMPEGDNTGLTTLPDVAGATLPGTLINFALTGTTSNWISSPVTRTDPALVFDPPLGEIVTGEDGSGGYSGSLRLSVPPVEIVSVTLSSSDPTAAQPSTAQLVFTPDDWNQAQVFSIVGVDDGVSDGDQAFTFTATSSSTDTCQHELSATQSGTTTDNDVGSVGIAATVQAEGDSGAATMEFTVVYGGSPSPAFTVTYSTQDGTALAGTDYIAAVGTLAFSGTPGENRTVNVPVLGNLVAQGDRAFTVQLGAPSNPNIVLAQGSAQGGIVDDDLDVQVSLENGVGVVQPGQPVAYDLVVTNLSPTLDAGLVPVVFVAVPLQDLAWSCVPSGGAICSGGAGGFADQAALPPSAQASYTVTGVASSSLATTDGPQHLVASAMADVANDSQPGNNLAVDVDLGAEIFIFADGFE